MKKRLIIYTITSVSVEENILNNLFDHLLKIYKFNYEKTCSSFKFANEFITVESFQISKAI